MVLPPSTIIKAEILKNNGQPLPSSRIEELAKTVLLTTTEVTWLVEYICTTIKNRKEGAKKAAETRCRNKKSILVEKQYYCGICALLYEEKTAEIENWIGCDVCDT